MKNTNRNRRVEHRMTMKEIGKTLLRYAKFAFTFCLIRRGIPSQDDLPPVGTVLLDGKAKVVNCIDIKDQSVDSYGNGISEGALKEPSVAAVSAHTDYMATGSDGQF